MKKYFLLFLFLILGGMLYLWQSSESNEEFVSMENDRFSLKGETFYPITLNYMVSMQANQNELWACSYKGYNANFNFQYKTKDSCLAQLKAEMGLIKELGFNSVRLVAIGEERIDKTNGKISIGAELGDGRDTSIALFDHDSYKKYFDALEELFNVANSTELKIVFLVKVLPDITETEAHFRKLAHHFSKNTTIMAYDLFNEPLYFDTLQRNKDDVYFIVKRWKSMIRQHAPQHLFTIGLTGVREVFEWDPNLLDVDFISIHPYEYEPEQVRNEMYWYGKYIKKPWLIGETAIPADGDSVSYDDQLQFARKTLEQAYNCGAAGYSWWQYKDVEWHNFHANYLGLINHDGETKTKSGNIVKGTPKPTADAFRNYKPDNEQQVCLCLDNYYNYGKHKDFKLKGRLMDNNNQPIDGGIILAWNQWWTHSYHTITKEDGTFELYSNYPFYHWMTSATEYTMVRGDVSPDTAKTSLEGIPTIDIGDLKLKRLSPLYLWLKRAKNVFID